MSNRILIIVIAIAAMVTGFWVAQSMNTPAGHMKAPEFQGRIVLPARKISMPPLTSDDGSVFDQEDITGHWSLLFFGYTNCPDICPTTLNVLAQAKQKSQGEFPEVFFISVDPQRDTPDLLGEYVRYFDPTFKAVTGSPEMLQALSLQTSVVYMTVPAASGNEENYLVEHSSSLLLINPEGKLHAFMRAPHTVQSVLDALKAVNR